MGTLGRTSGTLCGANGTGIGVSGCSRCSHCVVLFMGLLTEFPILVCDMAAGTDAIMGTDVLGSVLPHTLDIKNGLLFTENSYTGGIPRFPAVFSSLATAQYHIIQRLYSIAPYVLQVIVLCPPVGYWRASQCLRKNTGLVVGRTLVDPSRWMVPVLVSNFSQDTVMVEPFSEVGMVAQVSAIQSVTETMDQPPCGIESLPMHLRDLLDQTSRGFRSCCPILICFLYPGQL